MKKSIIVVVVLCFTFFASTAQEVGVRLGSFGGNNAAVDAIFSFGKLERLHANASFGGGLGIDLLYDFFYKPVSIGGEDGFDWYMGVGPSLYIGDDFINDNAEGNSFLFGASFEIGMEYHFKFPLAVGFDYRPTFWIVEETSFDAGNFGAMARYVFGK
ncbi:MAG: outer membrane insertion C- signal [Reichenbachiella sp.]